MNAFPNTLVYRGGRNKREFNPVTYRYGLEKSPKYQGFMQSYGVIRIIP